MGLPKIKIADRSYRHASLVKNFEIVTFYSRLLHPMLRHCFCL